MESQWTEVRELLMQTTNYLYQENLTAAYQYLVATLPRLEYVIAQVGEERQVLMKEKLTEALDAMENGDNVLLADILQYEILEQLESVAEEEM